MRKRLVEQLFDEAINQDKYMTDLCKKAGLSISTVRSWRLHEPKLGNFIALVESLGGTVNIKWKGTSDECILPRQEPKKKC
jgi:hypothetical protein|tara:strand:+ start:106 stop:348 length:243 start_codon:yes stop_codon:yes gene_type:complete